MAKNDFSSEVAENYEQKCLCVLVLDLSGSMNEIVDDSTAVATGQTIYVDGKNYNIVTGGISKLDNLVEDSILILKMMRPQAKDLNLLLLLLVIVLMLSSLRL